MALGVSTRRNVSPGWPFCPPVFLPDGSRRLLTRGGFFSPSLDGGLPLLLLFSPSRRSNSAMRASCTSNSVMRSSFESWLSAVRSIESLNRHHHPLSNKIWTDFAPKPPNLWRSIFLAGYFLTRARMRYLGSNRQSARPGPLSLLDPYHVSHPR